MNKIHFTNIDNLRILLLSALWDTTQKKNKRVNIRANVKPYGKSLTLDNQGPRWSSLMKGKVYPKISWNCPFILQRRNVILPNAISLFSWPEKSTTGTNIILQYVSNTTSAICSFPSFRQILFRNVAINKIFEQCPTTHFQCTNCTCACCWHLPVCVNKMFNSVLSASTEGTAPRELGVDSTICRIQEITKYPTRRDKDCWFQERNAMIGNFFVKFKH